MIRINKFGYCADGHLHGIRPEFVEIAKTNKLAFERSMFTNEEFSEQTVGNRDFIPLEPTNCPNIEKILPFGRLAQRQNVLPRDEVLILPYDAEEVYERPAVTWLMVFEEHHYRLSETKAVGKSNLFELIEESYPELANEDIPHMTYETLREKFLRKFWSIEYQRRLFLRLIATSYPSAYVDNQRIRDFIFEWLVRFTFSTAYCTRDIVYELMRNIPPQCDPILRPLLIGCNMHDVYEVVQRNEDIFGVIYERIQPRRRRRDWLRRHRNSPLTTLVLVLPAMFVIATVWKYASDFFSD